MFDYKGVTYPHATKRNKQQPKILNSLLSSFCILTHGIEILVHTSIYLMCDQGPATTPLPYFWTKLSNTNQSSDSHDSHARNCDVSFRVYFYIYIVVNSLGLRFCVMLDLRFHVDIRSWCLPNMLCMHVARVSQVVVSEVQRVFMLLSVQYCNCWVAEALSLAH